MLITVKQRQRGFYKDVRRCITHTEKSEWDKRIFFRLINSNIFKDFDLFLIYVSVFGEPDTYNIIDFALKNGKRIAVPYCKGQTMDFYEIHSLDDLEVGAFGIPTVDASSAQKFSDFNNSICIVPALAFDIYGNRLGYGGGFYDRFLSKNEIQTLGLCYERCISAGISAENYDVKINSVLTENGFRNSKNKEVSTYE